VAEEEADRGEGVGTEWRSSQRDVANFFFVGGIIGLGVFLPTLLFENMTRSNRKEK